jgi:hypothetical protein
VTYGELVAHTAISRFLTQYMLVPMVAIWVYHLAQRKYAQGGERKRLASMTITVLIMGLWIISYLFLRFKVEDLFLLLVFLPAAGLTVWQKKLFFPFRLTCAACRAPLPLRKILFLDSNACDACDPPKHKEGDEKS